MLILVQGRRHRLRQRQTSTNQLCRGRSRSHVTAVVGGGDFRPNLERRRTVMAAMAAAVIDGCGAGDGRRVTAQYAD